MNRYGIRQQELATHRNALCPEADYVRVRERIVNQLQLLRQRVIDVREDSLSDAHNELGNSIFGI